MKVLHFFIISSQWARMVASVAGLGTVNRWPCRDDMAGKQRSNAGLLKMKTIIAAFVDAFLTPIQVPCGINTVAPVLASYSRPASVTRTVP